MDARECRTPLRREKILLRGVSRTLISIARYVFLIAVGYVVLYPLIFMVSTSLRTNESFFDPSVIWIPKTITFENFSVAWEGMRFPQSLLNTVYIMVLSAMLQVFSCAIPAYGLARFRFKLNKVLQAVLLLTIIVPPTLIIIPLTSNFNMLGLLNTPFSFYLPALFGVGLNAGIMIYIYIQFFKGLPVELEEAAWIDGAGPIKTFLTIVIPSSGIVILVETIFSVIWHWNEFYLPVMYLSDQTQYPLAVALSELPSQIKILENITLTSAPRAQSIVMCGCIMFILPMLLMYLVLQKWFIESIDRVGIVG